MTTRRRRGADVGTARRPGRGDAGLAGKEIGLMAGVRCGDTHVCIHSTKKKYSVMKNGDAHEGGKTHRIAAKRRLFIS